LLTVGLAGTPGLGGTIANSAASPAHTLTFTNTGSIAFSGNTTFAQFVLSGSNTGDNSFVPQIGDGAQATNFTKSGSGKWIVTGAHTYTGATLITGGTLLVNGSTGTGATTVNANAFLGGNGTTSAVTLNSNGGLAAKISNWTGTAGIGFDDLTAASLDAGNFPTNLKISTAGLVNFSEVTKSFTILNTTGSITNFNPANVTISVADFPGTGTWSVAQSPNTLVLTYTAGAGGPTYASWANDPFKGNIPGEPATGDFDNDGLSNLVEYALGKNPRISDQPPGTLVGKLVTFTKGPDAKLDPTISYIIEQSTTLSGWTEVVTDNNSANDSVSFLLSATPKDFARLKIVQN